LHHLFECDRQSSPWAARFKESGTGRLWSAKKTARVLLIAVWLYGLQAAHCFELGWFVESDIRRDFNQVYCKGQDSIVEAISSDIETFHDITNNYNGRQYL